MPVNITPETFYDLTLQLSTIVQNTYLGEATATSSSSDDNIITDTNNDQVAGYYANTIYQGTAWLPAQGTFHLITAHALNTLTISPSATTPVASGEDYYAAPPFFPLQVLKHSINRALYSIGKIELVTSVTAVADQETYASTDNAAFGEEISHIHMASATSVPYNYNEVFGWDQEEDRTFRWRYNSISHTAYPIRITYKTYSTELVDGLSESPISLFMGVGPLMARALSEFRREGIAFSSAEEAGVHLSGMLREGDIVLIKGSRSMAMEAVLRRLKAGEHAEDGAGRRHARAL